MQPFQLVGGVLVTDVGMRPGDIAISDGLLSAQANGSVIDVSGFILAPGIIDLHGDSFIHHVAPRRGMITDPVQGLVHLDTEYLANGITTAVMAQFISWEGGMRGPDFCVKLVDALQRANMDCDTHLQIRLERFYAEGYPLARQLIEDGTCRYLVFNDHLPHEVIAAGKRPPRLAGQSLKAGRNPEKQLALIQQLCALAKAGPLREEAELIEHALAHVVVLGSHDDPDAKTREAWRARNVHVAEFPESMEAAQSAKTAGEPVIMGAPNVVRNGSHNKLLNAREAIAEGLVDALVSDYHYPSLLGAARALDEAGIMDFAEAWALISERPAEILGLTDRGRIAPGLRADLVVIDEITRQVVATMVKGQIVQAKTAFMRRLSPL